MQTQTISRAYESLSTGVHNIVLLDDMEGSNKEANDVRMIILVHI